MRPPEPDPPPCERHKWMAPYTNRRTNHSTVEMWTKKFCIIGKFMKTVIFRLIKTIRICSLEKESDTSSIDENSSAQQIVIIYRNRLEIDAINLHVIQVLTLSFVAALVDN